MADGSKPVELHYMPLSAPCRSVLLLAKSIGLQLTPKLCNVLAGDNRTQHYLQMNPQHTIPTMDDNGFYLWESRAILSYLASKYGPAHLYPSDPRERAVVDQRLYFDMGTLYERFAKCTIPLMFGNRPVDEDAILKLNEALGWLEGFFGDNQYVAGPKQTVADFSLASTIATIEASEVTDFMPYPKLRAWLASCKAEMPGYAELNDDGAKSFGELYKQAKAKASA
ncbi:Glutathione S-transferase 1, isoform D [Amphibalanus amphitrite]|uniref:Glutathione S-transferase 1, isoform D n=1 Tax=Amphibalanus amphitrite TaxID=1232801 RepID=A0A6A4WFP3_AMPAM|nr:glutathione S-transferase 1-like [Amphibalanus amphitrite]XP_043213742.1 glutathione S-transferase 1-like [Amphibalanus amphitrite]KAF0306387.1 Glutathione S-transferase 1, isoform D [Amphibalanus amphitrite]